MTLTKGGFSGKRVRLCCISAAKHVYGIYYNNYSTIADVTTTTNDIMISETTTDALMSRIVYYVLVTLFTARSSYASAVLGIVILSVCPSVRPSVTRLLCDETIEHTLPIF